jgi:DNA primase
MSQQANEQLIQLNQGASQWFEMQLREPGASFVLHYLKKRGITKGTVNQFKLGYAPESGLKAFLLSKGYSLPLLIEAGLLIRPDDGREPYERFRRRLIFPIQDVKGRIIGFGGRIIDQGEPKYLNSPDTPLFHKGKNLYGLSYALPRSRQGEPLVVVEGYMDVISLHQGGVETAVAPLGTALTPEQIQVMWRAQPNPILCFDGDEAGQRAAERAAQKCLDVIKPGYSLQFAFLPSGEDPDSLIRRQGSEIMRSYLARAIPLIDMLWRVFVRDRSWDTPEKKAKARQDLQELTQAIRDPDTRHFYRQELNQRLQDVLIRPYLKEDSRFLQAHINPADRPILGEAQKNLQGQKILLATLINHPTLISEIAEQLMILELASGSLSDLRDTLLKICMQKLDLTRDELVDRLKETGFSELIAEFENSQWSAHARFVGVSASYKEALQGWNEVWQLVQENQRLQDETSQMAAAMISSFDEGAWHRLKLLKQSLMRPRN